MDEQYIPLSAFRPEDARSDGERLAAAEGFRMLMTSRRTIRDFSPAPVPRALVESAIRTAATAPSGANQQPWHFCLVGDQRVKRRIRLAAEAEEREFYAGRAGEKWLGALSPLGTDANKPFLETAPWLIVMFAERKGKDGSKNYYVHESCGIALGLLIAALHSAGLGTLTHTPAPMGFLSAELGRPENEKPYVLLVTGHPAKDATVPRHATKKKALDEILSVY